MKNLLCLLLVFGSFLTRAQNRKVEMLNNCPIEEAFKKAKKEKKYILLDFGSPRCGPCLYIKNKIFTIDSVADFVNEQFVSVDYTQGEEKKRLSKLYEVYSEPVILLIDSKGNLMHRMEGKCSAVEMMSRLRQGLDKHNNLVALAKQYEDGCRDLTFLTHYLETLHIAGLLEQKSSVLKDVFYEKFDLNLLKNSTYWNLFLRYNESPVSKEGCFVFENRKIFYNLFGENIVRKKIDNMFSVRVRNYIYGHVSPIESEEFIKILTLLQASDYEKSTEWLAYLVPAQYKFKDWRMMVNAIQSVIDLNVFMGKDKLVYMTMLARQICWYSEDVYALNCALRWIQYLLLQVDEDEINNIENDRNMIMEKIADCSNKN